MASCLCTDCVCVEGGELGVALSGGGARALAQLGVLKVLEREKIPVSYVAGTSGGAIVGAVYVISKDAVEAEDRILRHLSTTGIGFNAETFTGLCAQQPTGYAGWVDVARRLRRMHQAGGALIGGKAMWQSLHLLLGDATFEDARIPFAAVTLDVRSGRCVIFAEGSLVDAVYASSAIPGLFEPLVLGDHLLVDGGWVEPVPVRACRHLGAILTLAVDMGPQTRYERVATGVATAIRADALARNLLEGMQLQNADLVLRPQVELRNFADFSDPEGTIVAGQRAAERALPEIVGLLEQHQSLFVKAARQSGSPPG